MDVLGGRGGRGAGGLESVAPATERALDGAPQHGRSGRAAQDADIQAGEPMRRKFPELADGGPRDDFRPAAVDVANGLDQREPVLARQREIGDEEDGRAETPEDAERFFAVPRHEHAQVERLDRFDAGRRPLNVGVGDEYVRELGAARAAGRLTILIVGNVHVNDVRCHVGSCTPRPTSGILRIVVGPVFIRTRFFPSAFAW